MDARDLERLLVEVSTGRPSGLPETDEVTRIREQLRREVGAIVANGGSVDVPAEVPDMDGDA